MALSERLRVAMERRARATALPAYLERVRSELGITLERDDLLTDDARDALRGARLDAQRQAMAQESERRTEGLSAEDAEGLAARLSTLLADQIVIVGFGQNVPALARIPLHTILMVATRAARQWGDLFVTTEDGTSTLLVDLLLPGDYGNRHPEGSYELVLRGPLFDGVDLPDLYTLPSRPASARARAHGEPSGGSPLGPDAGKLPG